jgi:hypothetical protein
MTKNKIRYGVKRCMVWRYNDTSKMAKKLCTPSIGRSTAPMTSLVMGNLSCYHISCKVGVIFMHDVGDAVRRTQGNPHEALPHAFDLCRYHDHRYRHCLFCRPGQPSSKVKL